MTKTQINRITNILNAVNKAEKAIFKISNDTVTMTADGYVGWEFPMEILNQTEAETPAERGSNLIENTLNECANYTDTHINAKEFLAELKAIYKEKKKTDPLYTKTPYIIKYNDEYYGFRISLLIEVFETLGTKSEIFISGNKYKPLYIKSDIGRAVLLPVRVFDNTSESRVNKII